MGDDADADAGTLDTDGPEPLDLIAFERELCRLPDVSVARLVADDVGRIIEAHIIAAPTKHPKQIVRDVQSVLLAEFGVELDRKVVSVVQLGDADLGGAPGDDRSGPARPSIVSIQGETNGLRSLVRVTLGDGDGEAIGSAQGSIATTARHRLVADATIDALRRLDPAAECLDVEHAQVVRVGASDVAVVTIVFVVPPNEQVVSGSAIVRANHDADAVARAVLDATNRRLPHFDS
ncbi:MAG TPA: hypothetical protein VH914_11625 [Acidimicrobiia bacterium]|jgi:hypothetical protein|nr:hypothetical protein [Acidimicrobiia bacterium]